MTSPSAPPTSGLPTSWGPRAAARRGRLGPVAAPAGLHGQGAHVGRDTLFEACAARLWQLIAAAVSEVEITRPTRDEGRDAVGTCSIGPDADQVKVDFALEAKCYNPSDTRGVGVKETAPLISRLLHRQFGVLVTTAFVGETAYKEIRQDGHPVVIVSAVDIVTVLRQIRSQWVSECLCLAEA